MAFHAHAVPIQSFLIQPEQVRVLSDNPQDLYKALLGQNTISKVWKGDYCGTQVALLSYHSALTTRKESLSVQSAKSNTPIKEILWQETLDVLTRIVLPNPHPNLVQVYGVSVEQTATEELSSQIIPVEEDDASNLTFIMENSWSLRMKKRQNTRKPSAKTSDETSSSSSSRRKNSTIRASFHKTSSFSMKSPTNVLIKEEKSNSLSEPIIMESMEIDVRPVYVVMEFLPTSLYQILHEDQIALTNFEIMDLSTQILQALQFVHTRGLCLHNLTSRKVMLKGNQVKIRGLGQKDILFKSGLILEEELQVDKESDNNRHHLFAFGLLLFEMCTGKIPNEENINQLSYASQKDPFFEKIIRLCLQIPPSSATENQKISILECKLTIQDILKEMLQHFHHHHISTNVIGGTYSNMLLSQKINANFIQTRFQHENEIQVLSSQIKLQAEKEFTTVSTVSLKRLEAIEKNLIEEQKQFEKTSKENEQNQHQIEIFEKKKFFLQKKIDFLQQQNKHFISKIHFFHEKNFFFLKKFDVLILLFQQKEKENDFLKDKMNLILKEKQDLWIQFCQKDDANLLLIQEKNQLKEMNRLLTQKIQQEKALVEDLTPRYQQAIHGLEETKKQNCFLQKKIDNLQTKMDILQTRCINAEIQIKGRGIVFPNEMDEILLLKKKEIFHLQQQMNLQLQQQIELEKQFEEKKLFLTQTIQENQILFENEKNNLLNEIENIKKTKEKEIQNLFFIQKNLQNQLIQQELMFDTHKKEMILFQQELKEQLENIRTKKCLTKGCDAPKYLIQASGFCVECQDKTIALTTEESHFKNKIHKSKTKQEPKTERGFVNTNHLFTSSSIKLNHNNSSSINKKWLRPLCQKDQKELEEWHQVFEIMEEVNDSKNNQEKEEEEEQEQANKRMKTLDHLSTELKKLIQIAKSNERLKDGLTEWNAFKVLVEFMFLQQDKLPFQIECCKLMSVLVFNHDRNRIQLVTDGGVEVVLESMKKYPQEIKLQEHAAVVLTNLAHNAESNRKKIFNLGGIDMILAAMEQFPLLKSVQKRCLWALLTLAGSDWMCEGITARGGIGAILAAMLNCPSDESVQYYGSWALLNLVSGTSPESTTNVARIKNFARQEGVLEVCEAALACFPEHPGIQEKARNVLELVATQHR